MHVPMTDYPPLTPVEVYPLHGWDYGAIYACKGGSNQYDWRCPECVSIAWHEVVQGRDVTTMWRQSADHEERPVTLGWLVARSRAHGVKAEIIKCGCVYDEHDPWCPATSHNAPSQIKPSKTSKGSQRAGESRD